MDWLLNQPWDKVAAFAGAWIAILTLVGMLAIKLPKVGTRIGDWIGGGLQAVLGVKSLGVALDKHTETMTTYVKTHAFDTDARAQKHEGRLDGHDTAIDKLTLVVHETNEQVKATSKQVAEIAQRLKAQP